MENTASGPRGMTFARDANIGWIRLSFEWDRVQPDCDTGQWPCGPGSWNESSIGNSIAEAEKRGLNILVTLAYAPKWANGGRDRRYPPTAANYAAWQEFVRMAVTRYPSVTHWSIWNEPNDGSFLQDNPDNTAVGWLAETEALITYAAPVIRDPAVGDKLVGYELAYHHISLRDTLVQSLNRIGGVVDVIAVHHYGLASDSYYKMNTEIIEANPGPVNGWKPMWLTEVALGGVRSEQEKSDHLEDLYTRFASRSNTLWEKTFYFHLFAPGFNFGLLDGWIAAESSPPDSMRITPKQPFYRYHWIASGRPALVHYQAHVQDYAWMDIVNEGAVAGRPGDGRRMEAVKIWLGSSFKPVGSTISNPIVCYQAHVEAEGWQGERCDGQVAGTTQQYRRMEAIRIYIKDPRPGMRVCYQAYAQDHGWMGVVCDGAPAGTTGESRRMEGLRIWIYQ